MPEHVHDLVVQRDLLVEVEVAGEERVVDLAVAKVGDQSTSSGLISLKMRVTSAVVISGS